MATRSRPDRLTYDLVQKFFYYKDGHLYWKIKKGSRIEVDQLAGFISKSNGYRYITINGDKYYEKSMIFLYHHGYYPPYIDNIDTDKLNNRIENLRECTLLQQKHRTAKLSSLNKYRGVTLVKKNANQYYIASIRHNKQNIHLGCFNDEIDTAKAYDAAAKKIYGEFAMLNFSNAGTV